MAKIMRNEKQENALKQLQEMMAEVMQLNHLLASKSYIICDPEDKKLRYPLHSSQKETLTSLLLQRKKNLVRKMGSIARENRIEFDEKELAVMKIETSV